jgi:hypothetical protein
VECILIREHDFPQKIVVFVQFIKRGHYKLITGYPILWSAPFATCKHTDANAFVTPDALSNATFLTHMLQLESTCVDCRQRLRVCFRQFHRTPLDALHLSCTRRSRSP